MMFGSTVRFALLVTITLTAAGCVGENVEGTSPSLADRALEAEGVASGVDPCAELGWYGEISGFCDGDYCSHPDPDCGCPTGLEVGSDGAQGCVCAAVGCDLACPMGGFAVDANGCELCVCATPLACPEFACAMFCEYGYVTDADGCPTCECVPGPGCAPMNCEMFCEFGFARDASGCELCQCAQAPSCEPPVCGLFCENGYATDANGCELCACVEGPACAPVACAMFCEFGFAKDADGCEVCECAPGPVGCASDAECGAGSVCEPGSGCDTANPICVPGCHSSDDCTSGEVCETVYCDTCPCPGVCAVAPGGQENDPCTTDGDCALDLVCEPDVGCDATVKICVPGCRSSASCAPGETCDTTLQCISCPCPPVCL